MRKQSWIKRDPIKNYFPLPNEIYSLGLSSSAIAVYGYLLCREDRKTYALPHPAHPVGDRAVQQASAQGSGAGLGAAEGADRAVTAVCSAGTACADEPTYDNPDTMRWRAKTVRANIGKFAGNGEEQEKAPAHLLRQGGHNHPQCGRFRGRRLTLFRRAASLINA